MANLPLRSPAVLAKHAATLDVLSGGRFELGLGAGAFWDGIAAYGRTRLTPGESVDALSEAIELIRALWSDRHGVSFAGRHYRLQGAMPGPPPAHDIGIWIGAYKPRMLRLTGRQADGWIPSFGRASRQDLRDGHARIDEAAADAGRDAASIRASPASSSGPERSPTSRSTVWRVKSRRLSAAPEQPPISGLTRAPRRPKRDVPKIACSSTDERKLKNGPYMKVAVVGHVEWVEFVRVSEVPATGEIVHASEGWEQAAGGGAVAAVQMARLAGGCLLCTALGDDELGHKAKRELEQLGVQVEVAWRDEPQRRAFVFLDKRGERTITTIGERLEPQAADPLPWADLAEVGAVYFTAGDADALRLARAAGQVVATPRAMSVLAAAHAPIDVLVASSTDAGERYRQGDLDPAPTVVARTAGSAGGSLEWADGRESRWEAAPLPGPAVDAYGAGDSFAGGLTYGLAAGRSLDDAVALGARCGAACMTGRGPYDGQLRSTRV